mmetsp:Transcript_10942/g.29257  ORF Transcript_10942/g.29257 Transcript_10942/m.29257 type:complete len:340 (-) Transcript_10942:670-1689(-)
MTHVETQVDKIRRQVCHRAMNLVLGLQPSTGMWVQGALDAVTLRDLGNLDDRLHELLPAIIGQLLHLGRPSGGGHPLLSDVRNNREEPGPVLLEDATGLVRLLQDCRHFGRLMQLLEDVSSDQFELVLLQQAPKPIWVVVAHRAKLRARKARLGNAAQHTIPWRVGGAVCIVHAPRAGVVGELKVEGLLGGHQGIGDEVANLQGLDCRLDAGHALGEARSLLPDVVHDCGLERKVLAILQVEVGHAAGLGSLDLLRARRDLGVGADRLENLLAANHDHSLTVLATASVTPKPELLTRLRPDREAHTPEILEAIACLAAGVLLVCDNILDPLDSQAVVSK